MSSLTESIYMEGETQCEGKIRLRSASYTSSLNSLILSCDNEDCKARKTMGDALLKATFSDYICKGRHAHRPSSQNEKCSADLIPSLRGATNVYFSIVRSALEIPPWSDKLFQLVEEKKVEVDIYIENKKSEAEVLDEEFNLELAEKIGLKIAYKEIDPNLMTFDKFVEIYQKVTEGASEYSEIKESEYNSILNHTTVSKIIQVF